MSQEVKDAASVLVQILTGKYWNKAMISGLDARSASVGLRFGMTVAMRHPEYAQAYLQITRLPEERAIQGFIEMVPVEGIIEDVVPPGE